MWWDVLFIHQSNNVTWLDSNPFVQVLSKPNLWGRQGLSYVSKNELGTCHWHTGKRHAKFQFSPAKQSNCKIDVVKLNADASVWNPHYERANGEFYNHKKNRSNPKYIRADGLGNAAENLQITKAARNPGIRRTSMLLFKQEHKWQETRGRL